MRKQHTFLLLVRFSIILTGCAVTTSTPQSGDSATASTDRKEDENALKSNLLKEINSVIVDSSFEQQLASLSTKDHGEVCQSYCDNNSFSRCRSCLYTYLQRQEFITTHNLTIVPHGILHNIPFNVLIDETGEFLIENYSIRMLPSAAVLPLIKEDDFTNDLMLILSDPFTDDYDFSQEYQKLQYSYLEGKNIASSSSNARHLTDRAATETMVKKFGPDVGILHISSHAKFYQANPLSTRLLLAGDDYNDGSLNVIDINSSGDDKKMFSPADNLHLSVQTGVNPLISYLFLLVKEKNHNIHLYEIPLLLEVMKI